MQAAFQQKVIKLIKYILLQNVIILEKINIYYAAFLVLEITINANAIWLISFQKNLKIFYREMMVVKKLMFGIMVLWYNIYLKYLNPPQI